MSTDPRWTPATATLIRNALLRAYRIGRGLDAPQGGWTPEEHADGVLEVLATLRVLLPPGVDLDQLKREHDEAIAAAKLACDEAIALGEAQLRTIDARDAARRDGWQRAIACLEGVVRRTGSPSARYWADYLTIDPDKERDREVSDGG